MSFIYNIPGVRLLQTKLNSLTSYCPPPPPETHEPRRIVMVHSHPSPDSFSKAMADAFEVSSLNAGHEVKRINLYNNDNPTKCYRPHLSKAERESYFQNMGKDDPKQYLAPEVRKHVEMLQWCNTLVFIYPTWWMNTPASLKGFLDRTLVPGITWDFPSKDKKGVAALGLTPKLQNVEQIVGISTYGASQGIVTLAGDNGRRMISNAVRHSVCPNATVTWLSFYHLDTVSDDKRKEFLEQVKQLPREL
jgi:putative NADPH-quinone reductase